MGSSSGLLFITFDCGLKYTKSIFEKKLSTINRKVAIAKNTAKLRSSYGNNS
jgi:hypothetical protein